MENDDPLIKFLIRPDIQAMPGIKKALENILTGRKPVKRKKGEPMLSAVPAELQKK
jgi:hypothetical protein